MDDDPRAELLARVAADQAAIGAVYASADQYRDPFVATNLSTSTPWPFAILEWEPELEAPEVVQTAVACVSAAKDPLTLRAAIRRAEDHVT